MLLTTPCTVTYLHDTRQPHLCSRVKRSECCFVSNRLKTSSGADLPAWCAVVVAGA